MTRFTVFGGRGFVGSHLVAELEERGHDVAVPNREWIPTANDSGGFLGTVIYAIGLTADFRRAPLATVEAHVSKLARILEHGSFRRLVYLSSARVYRTGDTHEESTIPLTPSNFEHLYDLSKLFGESTALHSGRDVRIARLSNVVGSDSRSENFITALIREAKNTGQVTLRSDPDSAKDFVTVEDVTQAVINIAEHGLKQIYNVASGTNTDYRTVVETICNELDVPWTVTPNAIRSIAAPIDVGRLRDEFGHVPRSVLDGLPETVRALSCCEAT